MWGEEYVVGYRKEKMGCEVKIGGKRGAVGRLVNGG